MYESLHLLKKWKKKAGEPDEVLTAITHKADQLFNDLTEAQCVVSPKSTLLASTNVLGRNILRRLKAAGIPLKIADFAKDLGVASSAGKDERRNRRCRTAITLPSPLCHISSQRVCEEPNAHSPWKKNWILSVGEKIYRIWPYRAAGMSDDLPHPTR